MPEPGYILAAVLLSSAITWSLRALPFAALAPLRSSALLPWLSVRMPLGVMVILTLYTVRDVRWAESDQAWPWLIAIAATTAVHLWRRNLALSIVGGTAVFVVLTSVVFT